MERAGGQKAPSRPTLLTMTDAQTRLSDWSLLAPDEESRLLSSSTAPAEDR
jgi:hypothetical protein